MRKLAVAMISLSLAVALGAVAVPLAVWAAMASYRAEWASGWALWALERSPLPLYAAPVRVATDVMQRDFLVVASLAAVLLCLLAFSALRSAQRALRSAEESHDGKATIELKTQALRVGRPVEGSIWLSQRPERGELYRVQLSCTRGHGPGKSDRAETAYWEELEAVPVSTPAGWSLPFRFVVPPIAPPSGVSSFTSGPGYHWRLAVERAQGWMSFPSVFALHLAPAPAEELGAIERRGPGRMEPGLKHADAAITRSAGREPTLQERPALREELKQANGGIARNAALDPPLHALPEFRERVSRGGTGDRQTLSRDPLAGCDRAADQGRVSDTDPLRAAGGQIPEGRLTTVEQGPQFIGDATRVRRKGSPPTIACEVRSPEKHRGPSSALRRSSSAPRRAPSFGDATRKGAQRHAV
jgi:hypothetical protein